MPRQMKPTTKAAIRMLAKGHTVRDVAAIVGLNIGNVYEIRRKYQDRIDAARDGKRVYTLSPRTLKLIEMRANGAPFKAICAELGYTNNAARTAAARYKDRIEARAFEISQSRMVVQPHTPVEAPSLSTPTPDRSVVIASIVLLIALFGGAALVAFA